MDQYYSKQHGKTKSLFIQSTIALTLLLGSVNLYAFNRTINATKKLSEKEVLEQCEKQLEQKMKGSLIKKKLFHVSLLKEPCKGVLTTKVSNERTEEGKTFYPESQLKSPYASWGVNPKTAKSSINLDKAWKIFKKKNDITVAVIDTGIDPHHAYLKGNIYVKEGFKGPENYGVDFSFIGNKSTKTPSDDHGHGTHVSGIIKSVFPDVKLLALKYYNPHHSGQQNLDSTVRALEYAVNAGVDIINYSGGGPEPAVQELRILKEAERKGILIVAAAGNDRSNIDNKFNAYYPASYGLSNIITVTAYDQQLNTLNSSNWGKSSVDLSAPGNRIKSSIPLNRSSFMTGTSQATAFVTGVAAMLKSQYPELSAQDIKMIVRNSAVRITSLEGKSVSGGKLDAERALVMAKDYLSKPNNTRTLAADKK